MYEAWCEWDFGQEDYIFSTEEKAWAWLKRMADEVAPALGSFESLKEVGLVDVEYKRLDPDV